MVGSQPRLADSVIRDCTADEGAGIHALDADLTITDSTIVGGHAARGGGIFATDTDLQISSSDFDANRAAGDDFPTLVEARGGGLWLSGCVATIENTSFTSNVALFEGFPGSSRGGALHAEGATTLELFGCYFAGNVAGDDFDLWISGSGGGAFVTCGCSAVVQATQFDDNVAGGIPAHGGGYRGQGTITSCSFVGNRCGAGGALSSGGADHGGGAAWSTLTHCARHRNEARIDGGAVGTDFFGAQSTIRNSILWDNAPAAVVPGASFEATYSDIEGGAPGAGNLDADPEFWMPLSDDFHLKPTSPCVDAGDPASPPDSDGSRADMGPLELILAWNPAPGNYCEALPHSDGCVATMGSIGRPSLTGPDTFARTVRDVLPSTPGIFIWSRTAAEVPFMDATLCLGSPIARMPVVVTAGLSHPCTGTASQPFTQAAMAAAGLVPYETIHAQFWYRDPSTLPFGVGLSDGLEITVRP